MKLAVVAMTFNDGHKIRQWREHYNQYKNEVNHFVIVDNGSESEYVEVLRRTFPEAIIIERKNNGGCTAAYNDGIRYILNNTDDKAIAIVANDMKLSVGCLTGMYDYLFQEEHRGIVSTAILNKNSNIIDNFGLTFNYWGVKKDYRGIQIEVLNGMRKDADLVSGGFYMAKRDFFVCAGLQDEKLFMYCDELDTMLLARKHGYLISVMSDCYAWHHHVRPADVTIDRYPQSAFMISRNRIYLAKKYFGLFRIMMWWFYTGIAVPSWYVVWFVRTGKPFYLSLAKHSFLGAIYGLVGNMTPNKFSFPIGKKVDNS